MRSECRLQSIGHSGTSVLMNGIKPNFLKNACRSRTWEHLAPASLWWTGPQGRTTMVPSYKSTQESSKTIASRLTHWAPGKMTVILRTIFSNSFSSINIFEFWLRMKFVSSGPINNIPVLVQTMARHRIGTYVQSASMRVVGKKKVCFLLAYGYQKITCRKILHLYSQHPMRLMGCCYPW